MYFLVVLFHIPWNRTTILKLWLCFESHQFMDYPQLQIITKSFDSILYFTKHVYVIENVCLQMYWTDSGFEFYCPNISFLKFWLKWLKFFFVCLFPLLNYQLRPLFLSLFNDIYVFPTYPLYANCLLCILFHVVISKWLQKTTTRCTENTRKTF